MHNEGTDLEKWQSIVKNAARYHERGFVPSGEIRRDVRNRRELRQKVIPFICAYDRTTEEFEALGKPSDMALVDGKLANRALCRFNRWQNSISNLLDYEKAVTALYEYPLFPAALRKATKEEQDSWVQEHSVSLDESAMNRASVVGRLLHNQATADSSQVREFIADCRKHTPSVWNRFLGQVAGPASIRPEKPELDLWLISIWPIVVEQGWTWDQVFWIATKKFKGIGDKGNIQGADSMRMHVTEWVNRRLPPLQQLWTDSVRSVGKQLGIKPPKLNEFALNIPSIPPCLQAVGFSFKV